MIFQNKTGLHPLQQKLKVILQSKRTFFNFFTSRCSRNTKRLEITAIGNQHVRKNVWKLVPSLVVYFHQWLVSMKNNFNQRLGANSKKCVLPNFGWFKFAICSRSLNLVNIMFWPMFGMCSTQRRVKIYNTHYHCKSLLVWWNINVSCNLQK